MNTKLKFAALVLTVTAMAAFWPRPASAQTVNDYTENFTGTTNTLAWYYFNGACLTAGSSIGNATTGVIPSCAYLSQLGNYYNEVSGTFNTLGIPLGGGNSGNLNIVPDTPTTGGALRFTNWFKPYAGPYPDGYFESGAIVSQFSFPLKTQGLQVTFTTETYGGDGGGGDGADGISFFLQDTTYAPDLGAAGGSLAYSCSNVNNSSVTRANGSLRGYDGLVGGYLGIGIDEYGNFNNPTDNTATGPGFGGGRIGLRGAGIVAWSYLNSVYEYYYPTALYNSPQAALAVKLTCETGILWNFSGVTTSTPSSIQFYGATPVTFGNGITIPIPDYSDITYYTLDNPIANESAVYRGYGTPAQLQNTAYGVPITYNLTLTAGGILNLKASYGGGAYINIINNYNFTTNNGPLPANVRFGFAGSDGGASNIHEIMCFQATPSAESQSSSSTNQKQSQPVIQGTQVYYTYYNPTTWSGSVVAESLSVNSSNQLSFVTPANWDAACVLTLVSSCSTTGVTTSNSSSVETPAERVMLTYSGSTGIPFESANLTTAESAALGTLATQGDSSSYTSAQRLNYLRGDQSLEQAVSSSGTTTGIYRDRASVLGDIIDSSPTWVGPPSDPYPNAWIDKFQGTTGPEATMPENVGGAQTYAAFQSQEGSRMNMVYVGANDGFLHGFRAGYFNNGVYAGSTNSSGTFVGTDNDGYELLAFMPQYVLNNIQTTTASLDYSNVYYGHKFDVDATPGVDDVFYNGYWHTILVSGIGPGGPDMFALDVTNPANSSIASGSTFSEKNASNLVIGEWNQSTLTCASVTSNAPSTTKSGTTTSTACGQSLGNTYGTPQIRRFHNGLWGAVFGNGYNSPTNDGGIFVMILNPPSGASNALPTATFYYLSTGTWKNVGTTNSNGAFVTPNGIAYTTPVDLDGDHITDYVYAGDLLGNVWRFDLTSTNPSQWGVTATPVFTTASGQPITSKILAVGVASVPNRRLMLEFGTGQQVPLTNSSPTYYAQGQQSLYGIWDWNLATWNATSSVQYAALPYTSGGTTYTAPTSGLTASSALQVQTFAEVTIQKVDYRAVSNTSVCYPGTTGCTTTQYGWYMNLATGYANPADVNLPTSTQSATQPTPAVYEQVIYNPTLIGDAFVVNTTIPATTSLTSCLSTIAGGYTMAINPATGGSFSTSVFPNGSYTNTGSGTLSGLAESGTGSVTDFMVAGNNFFETQTVGGSPTIQQVNLQSNGQGSRLTWIQKR